MSDLIKNTLLDDRKTFAVALGSSQEMANKYILGVYNTILLNNDLMKCTPSSIRDAAITSAVLGVAIDARQYAYLVPYGTKAQFQLSYKGYKHIAKRDLEVDQIDSVLVYEDDVFSFDKGANTLTHIPNLDSPKYGKEAHIKYTYAIVRFRKNTGRDIIFEVMTREQVDTIKNRAKQQFIWKSDYGEMTRKTVMKRLCKHAQLGDTAQLDEIDNGIEQGKIINITPTGELKVDDSLCEDRDRILSLIENALTQESLDKIFADNSEKIEELISNNLSTEINKAAKDRKEEVYVYKVQDFLENCEDLEGLEAVFKAHEERINTFKASRRNDFMTFYCGLKQALLDNQF